MNDPYELERFVIAQDSGGTYDRAVGEMRRGHKTSHWMWFVFPQIAGLGQSQMSRTYAISSLEEAKAYLQHPVLGQRLIECTGVVASAEAQTAEQIFGVIDTQMLHSSMTLFLRAEPNETLFRQVLGAWVRMDGGMFGMTWVGFAFDDAGKFLTTQRVRVSVQLNDTMDSFAGPFKTDFIGADGQVVASTTGTVQGTRIQVEPPA